MFDFPSSPSEGQIFAPSGGPAYQYSNGAWRQGAGIIGDAPNNGKTYVRRNGQWVLSYEVLADNLVFSGSSVTVTGIPDYATEVGIVLASPSTNGSVVPEIRVGTSAGLVSSGYTGYAIIHSTTPTTALGANSTGFRLGNSWANTFMLRGHAVLRWRASLNVWQIQGMFERVDVSTTYHMTLGQSPTLPASLDRIAVDCGANTFSTGNYTVWYRV